MLAELEGGQSLVKFFFFSVSEEAFLLLVVVNVNNGWRITIVSVGLMYESQKVRIEEAKLTRISVFL